MEGEPLAKGRVFERGEVPRGETGAVQCISAEVSEEPAVRRGLQERGRIEPLRRIAGDDLPHEIGVGKGPHWVAGISVV